MKTRLPRTLLTLLWIAASFTGYSSFAADEIRLQLKPNGPAATVEWHSRVSLPISGTYSEYRIERSTSLDTNAGSWQTVAGPFSGGVGVSDEFLRESAPASGDHSFYRIVADRRIAPAGNYGDAIYGYGTEFSRELQQLGQMSLDSFVSRYEVTNQYLPRISFDPTTARFWNAFDLDPAIHNAANPADPRLTDFRLNPQEFSVFQTNGFVVIPRLGSSSFVDAFYKVYTDDLPVFISADSVIHAWHRSYVLMLEELEETFLAARIEQIIRNMQLQISALNSESSATPLANGVLDADFFLAVARSLVTGTNNSGVLGQSSRIAAAGNAVGSLQPQVIEIFGANRLVDFSQFQVRGHYETSPRLQKYFRALMWCGLIDFRFTGSTNDNSLRELSGAIAMNMLLDRSGERTNWLEFDRAVQTFVGLGDSLNFAQLGDLLTAAGIHSPASLPGFPALHQLHSRIMSGQLGVQNIRNGYLPSPLSREQLTLPRSFAMMPQRFVLDSWVLGKVVFDDIIWDEDGIPTFEDKVPRRVPSALDVAFSVFGNDQIVPELAARIANTNGHPWRDGWPYQHNLSATRNVIDRQGDEYWTTSIYGSWLASLRALSAPTTDPKYPEAMRTRPWAMKTLNTQLASWTQLRHDTVLYAKQSYTAPVLCGYPGAFVEPRPEFWQRIREMALRTRMLITTLPTNGFVFLENVAFPTGSQGTLFVGLHGLQTNRLALMDQFIAVAGTLQGISEKQLSHTELTGGEMAFLQNVVERHEDYSFGNGNRKYTGWYPALYYRSARQTAMGEFLPPGQGSDFWDALVTDVHTDTPDAVRGDPGSILHEGVGNVHMALIAVDCGGTDLNVYAGPVLSHYEFELGVTTRKTDSQWKADIQAGRLPPHPEWTRSFLVPNP